MEPRIASKHYSLVFNTIYTPKFTPKLASLLREAQEAGSIIV
jgi:hypothetical protein